MNQPQSPRIELAQDAESKTHFLIAFGPAWLKFICWNVEDGEFDDETVIEADLYADRALTQLIAEDIAWQKLPDLDIIFMEIRSQAIDRDERKHTMPMLPNDFHPGPRCSCIACLRLTAEMDRDLANALILGKTFEKIFQRLR